jgi:tetratricopeptide (TPR) repeat protein
MKKIVFILILLLPVLSLKAQTNYSDGFRAGYKNGYCYGIEPGSCIAPIPPIPPIPSNTESPDSYQDGYNQGFSMGLMDQKKDSPNKNQGYQTTSSEPIDFINKLNIGSILEIADAQRQLKGIAFECYRNKEYNSSIALCVKLLPTDPYDPEVYLIVGECYYSQKNYKQALNNLKKAQFYDHTNSLVNIDKRILMIENEYNQTKN